MIPLHRLKGQRVAINPDLIESVEETPDTHVRLTSGDILLVQETLEDVVNLVMQYRRALISAFSLDPTHGVVGRTRPPTAHPSRPPVNTKE